MSPTIVFKDGKVELVTGSPGGSRIITTVLQIVVDVIDHGLNVAEAENAPRAHDQLCPDELRIERGISPDTIRLLEAMGHKVVVRRGDGLGQHDRAHARRDADGRLRPAATRDAGGRILNDRPRVSGRGIHDFKVLRRHFRALPPRRNGRRWGNSFDGPDKHQRPPPNGSLGNIYRTKMQSCQEMAGFSRRRRVVGSGAFSAWVRT